ncbi:MAG TPA: hypothetical protein VJV78_28305 [Polyangiales bacterium]|nr:hypothetical protein [Polyangiales bacterium]
MKCDSLWVCCLALALLATSASAQPGSAEEICLVARGCAPTIQGELLELLRLELSSERVVLGDPACAERAPALWIERACPAAESGELELRRSHPAGGRPALTARLRLDDVPASLWNRTLALALAELFRAGTAESSAQPEAATSSEDDADDRPATAEEQQAANTPGSAPAAPLPAVQATTSVASSPRPVWAVEAGPAMHLTPGRGTALFGAEVGLHWRRLRGGALATFGVHSVGLGQIDYRLLHAYAGVDVLQTRHAAWTFAAGIRAALGATFTNSTASSDVEILDTVALSGDLALDLSVALQISATWLARLGLDLGYAAGPTFHADDPVVDQFSGLFIGASLGLGAALSHER